MGCTSSVQVMATDGTTADVDAQLAEAKIAEQNHFKMLLLGAGESGKSTVVKQVKSIYKGPVTDKEKEGYITAIRRNVVECMQTLIEARQTLGVPLANSDLEDAEDRLQELTSDQGITPESAKDVEMLWADDGMQATYKRKSEFWMLDASPYYFNHCMRIADPEFDPSEEDQIMTRVRTTGIVVTEFEEKPQTYALVDVGGQRSERRKWIHCFDDVKAIIFLAGLSGYGQLLFEDTSMNRMHESLNLFGEVTKNPIFTNTPIFVLLNKKDLFEDSIKQIPLTVCFPEYTGPEQESKPALDYIESKYREVMETNCPGKTVNIHIIAARVRRDMKIAFGEIKDEMKKEYAKRYKNKK
ncbi:unnamed protein product [Chrysoparadoxa australica]